VSLVNRARVAPECCHGVQGWKWRCPPLTPPKQSSVKVEEVEDVEDEDVEMYSPSPPPPEAGPSQYTPPQVPTVISQKCGSDP